MAGNSLGLVHDGCMQQVILALAEFWSEGSPAERLSFSQGEQTE